MSSINKNIIANVIGKGWAMISAFIFIPFYIDILGIQLFGIIGFYTVLQGALIFADAGLTATLRREMALGGDQPENRAYKYRIVRSIEFVYLFIVLIIALSIGWGADYLATDWLEIENLDPEAVKTALQLMGVALALNFLSALYQGGLLGLERQVASNIFRVCWGLLKNGGVILVLLYVERSLFAFFLWHLIINTIYLILLRIYILRQIKKKDVFQWNARKDLSNLKSIWRYAFGMLLIAFIASLNNQLDKLVVSNLIGVSDFAVYTVAFTLSMVPVVISGPIAVAIFPKLTKFYSEGRKAELEQLFEHAFKFVLIVTSITGITLGLNASFFLELWTQKPFLANQASEPAFYLLAGQTLLSFQVIPFNLLLAQGNTRINVTIGALGLIVLVPTLILMVNAYGMLGAAISWVLYYSILTPVYLFYVIRYKTQYQWLPWLMKKAGKPLILATAGGYFFHTIGQYIPMDTIGELLYLTLSSGLLFIMVSKFSFPIKGWKVHQFLWKKLFAFEK